MPMIKKCLLPTRTLTLNTIYSFHQNSHHDLKYERNFSIAPRSTSSLDLYLTIVSINALQIAFQKKDEKCVDVLIKYEANQLNAAISS